ncbi:MAG TPA: hypothetical protein VMO26_29715 [Vicinamibacterales bacterium]|nr:hypothetical protein [Vicinamibacterales bacterium]
MADKNEFEFVLDAYTPDTLPMARLAEYLADLALLVGEKERVHFRRISEGSVAIAYAVDAEAVLTVRERVTSAQTADEASDQRRAFERINQKLTADNTSAHVREVGMDGARLLDFPGPHRQLDPQYGPFNEQGSLRGRVISVGGKQKIVNVNIQDGETVYYCEASREIALQLAPLMFFQDLRVFGTGRYTRTPDGEWKMLSFRITHHEPLEGRPLAEAVERLRAVTRRVGLDKDIIAKLAELRGSSEA